MFVSRRPYYRPIYKQGTEAIKCPCLKIKKDVFQIFCAYLIIAVNFETGLFGIIKDTEQRYKHVENEITNILDKRCFFYQISRYPVSKKNNKTLSTIPSLFNCYKITLLSII